MKCNRDCFHCPFDDCICEEDSLLEIREAEERDKLLDPTQEKANAERRRYKAYYDAHRDEILAKGRVYYRKNKDRAKAWNDAHVEWRSAYKKRYYAEHREKIRQQQKDYRRENRYRPYEMAKTPRNRETAAAIRQYRKENGWSAYQMANMVGISVETLNRHEAGYAIPRLSSYAGLPEMQKILLAIEKKYEEVRQ